jgi:hypothetical protein
MMKDRPSGDGPFFFALMLLPFNHQAIPLTKNTEKPCKPTIFYLF